VKILIHSNGPMVPSGYGQQTRLLIPRLTAMGHEVAVSAFYGLSGAPIKWEGCTVFPAGQQEYGVDVLVPHALTWGSDLVLTLMDFWKLLPCAQDLAGLNVAAWLPNDCTPLGRGDRQALAASQATPIAMSRFGQKQLQDAGYGDAAYVPHAVDRAVFSPPEDRSKLRQELGVDDRFIIGICAANHDALRKAWPEQFAAFAKFHKHHKDTLLMVHSTAHSPVGFNLMELARDMGITDAVMMSDEYAQKSGLMVPEMMAAWYGSLDMLSLCSYAEAFGVPLIEAQACGTPVIVTKGSAMTELSQPAWQVKGQPFWNPVHHAWWTRPNVDDIAKRYEQAYQRSAAVTAKWRSEAAKFAASYDADTVANQYWKPVLDSFELMPKMTQVLTLSRPKISLNT